MDQDQSLLHLVPVLWRHKWTILITSLLSGLLTAAVMLTKPNYYKSSALFYPVNNALLTPVIDMREQYQGYFGNDKDVDRLLSIGNSRSMAAEIIQEFNLAKHYKIKAETPKGQQKLLLQFKKLIDIHKTEFDAISLSVEDTDPTLAQKITQSLLEKIDQKAAQYGIKSQENISESLQKDIQLKKEQLQRLSDTITAIRKKYGIYDINVQAEALAELEMRSPNSSNIQEKIRNYNSGIAQLMQLETSYKELGKSLIYHQMEYDKIKNNIDQGISVIHVIEEPSYPLDKSRPRRSLYVLGSMLFVGLLTSAFVLIRDQLSKINFPQES